MFYTITLFTQPRITRQSYVKEHSVSVMLEVLDMIYDMIYNMT